MWEDLTLRVISQPFNKGIIDYTKERIQPYTAISFFSIYRQFNIVLPKTACIYLFINEVIHEPMQLTSRGK